MRDQSGQALLEMLGICTIGILFLAGAFTVLGSHFQRWKCERAAFEQGLLLRTQGQALSVSRCGALSARMRFSGIE